MCSFLVIGLTYSYNVRYLAYEPRLIKKPFIAGLEIFFGGIDAEANP